MWVIGFFIYYYMIAKDDVLYVMHHEESGKLLVVDKITFRVNQQKMYLDITKTKKFRQLYSGIEEHGIETAEYYYV